MMKYKPKRGIVKTNSIFAHWGWVNTGMSVKYLDVKRGKKLPNPRVTRFLAQFMNLCKSHKLSISTDDGALTVHRYDKREFMDMVKMIRDDTRNIDEDDESDLTSG